MTHRITGLCVASICSVSISLGAQGSTATATAPQTASASPAARDVTVTGCVAKAADGRFMLTNATVEPMSATTAGTTGGATTAATTGGTTSGGTTAGATTGATAGSAPRGMMAATPMSWTLDGGTDLDKHVGHKVQISGKTTWDSSMNRSMTASTAGTAGSTAGTAGSTAGGTTAGATTAGTGTTAGASRPSVNVSNLKMVSASCP